MAKKTKNSPSVPKQKPLPRKNHFAIALNDAEMKCFERYIKKNKIMNKSKFVRETIMLAVLKQLEADSPTLFDNIE